jgi:hypothetical protein
MNRNLIATIVVVILIVAASASYLFMNRPVSTPAPAGNMETSAQPSPVMEKTSLKSFMSMAGTQKCDFTDPDSGNSGTVYLDSGKMRGDFSASVGGKTSMTHMINDGKNAYIWMDDQATGFKTSISAIEAMSGQTGMQQTVDINKEVNYKCESWSADPLKFAVPAEIKFQDMSKMMEDAMKRMPSSSLSPEDKAAACSACSNLEGDAQTQCKRALKCS